MRGVTTFDSVSTMADEAETLKQQVRLLQESNKQLQEQVRKANNRMATATDDRDRYRQDRDRYRELVEDLRDHGVRFDLNPSMADIPQDRDEAVSFLCQQHATYLKRIDESVRNRALRALHPRKRAEKWRG